MDPLASTLCGPLVRDAPLPSIFFKQIPVPFFFFDWAVFFRRGIAKKLTSVLSPPNFSYLFLGHLLKGGSAVEGSFPRGLPPPGLIPHFINLPESPPLVPPLKEFFFLTPPINAPHIARRYFPPFPPPPSAGFQLLHSSQKFL